MKPSHKITQTEEDLTLPANELFGRLVGDMNQYDRPFYPGYTRLAEASEDVPNDKEAVELTREEQLERLIALGVVVRQR